MHVPVSTFLNIGPVFVLNRIENFGYLITVCLHIFQYFKAEIPYVDEYTYRWNIALRRQVHQLKAGHQR